MSIVYNDICIDHKLDMFWKHQDNLGSNDRRPYRTEILNFGYIWLSKITNKTRNKISFNNPWRGGVIADLAPGFSESDRCRGYIPLQGSGSRRYEIKYYDQDELEEEKSIEIVDEHIMGDWLICIQKNGGGIKRDVWDVSPPKGRAFSEVELTITDYGYEIFNVYSKWCIKGYI